MAITELTPSMLADEVKTKENDGRLAKSISVARELIDELVKDDADAIPDDVFDAAWLATAVAEFNRRKSPNGFVNQAVGEDLGADNYSVQVKVSANPLDAARGLLEVYLTPVVGGV